MAPFDRPYDDTTGGVVVKVLWTRVMQVQKKFRSDSIHVAPLETARVFNVDCGDDSIFRKCHMGSPRLGAVGPDRSGGWPCWLSVSLCW